MPRSSVATVLPQSLHVIERGWLSANTVVAFDDNRITLIDSGYHTHTHLLQAALQSLIGEQRIDTLYNTHLHSDHCGGNAWLAQHYAGITISIPQSAADAHSSGMETQGSSNTNTEANSSEQTHILDDPQAQDSYGSVGQTCPAFSHTAVHGDGDMLQWGGLEWRTIASPGHDNDSVIFFNDEHRILFSADALWENGFGALFPLIEGFDAIGDQSRTLDLIESLGVRIVIPGHGSVFTEVNRALDVARSRIASFIEKPERTLHNTFRVLMKFNLLEWQRLPWSEYRQRYARFGAIERLAAQVLPVQTDLVDFADKVADALVKAGAARWEGSYLVNA